MWLAWLMGPCDMSAVTFGVGYHYGRQTWKARVRVGDRLFEAEGAMVTTALADAAKAVLAWLDEDPDAFIRACPPIEPGRQA